VKAFAAVAGAGTMEDDTYDILRELSNDIGARLTGSPEAAKAICLGPREGESLGLQRLR